MRVPRMTRAVSRGDTGEDRRVLIGQQTAVAHDRVVAAVTRVSLPSPLHVADARHLTPTLDS
jgi:hypothetical protein